MRLTIQARPLLLENSYFRISRMGRTSLGHTGARKCITPKDRQGTPAGYRCLVEINYVDIMILWVDEPHTVVNVPGSCVRLGFGLRPTVRNS